MPSSPQPLAVLVIALIAGLVLLYLRVKKLEKRAGSEQAFITAAQFDEQVTPVLAELTQEVSDVRVWVGDMLATVQAERQADFQGAAPFFPPQEMMFVMGAPTAPTFESHAVAEEVLDDEEESSEEEDEL